MEKLKILCVEDQREVLNTIVSQLAELTEKVGIEPCEDAFEAMEVMDELDDSGDYVALVISDHVMPNMTGVELFQKMNEDGRFSKTRRILLTGQATHEDTIQAINDGNIDYYISKPWDKDELIEKVTQLLTLYVLELGIDYDPNDVYIHKKVLFNKLHGAG